MPEVRDLINRLLLARGFTLLCRGEVLTVAEIKKIDPSLVPRVEPADLPNRDPHEFVKVSFPLVSLVAETAAEDLKPMLSPNGRLTALSEIESPGGHGRRDESPRHRRRLEGSRPKRTSRDPFREFKLKHARADGGPPPLDHAPGRRVAEVARSGGRAAGQHEPAQQQQAMMMARMQAGNPTRDPQPPGRQSASKPKAAQSAWPSTSATTASWSKPALTKWPSSPRSSRPSISPSIATTRCWST